MQELDLGGVSGQEYYELVFRQHLDHGWNEAPGKEVVLNAVARNHLRFPTAGALGDIGCGTGLLLSRIQQEVLPEYRLIGVDFSKTAIDEGRKLYPRISLLDEDGAATSLAPSCLDIVVSYGSYEHFPDPAAGIKEMARLLKQTGHFFTMMPTLEAYWDNERTDEGWYPDKTGQLQWNLPRSHWESHFRANGLQLWSGEIVSRYGARKPDVFFFGTRGH